MFLKQDQQLFMSNLKVGIVSGYFNPIHKGHIEYINAAKKMCDFLICIVNNDYQVKLKKSLQFMDEQHRLTILKNIKAIDLAILSIDKDCSVAETLNIISKQLKKSNRIDIYFFNSGDRSSNNEHFLEVNVCIKNSINRQIIDLPKICSSSELKGKLSSNDV